MICLNKFNRYYIWPWEKILLVAIIPNDSKYKSVCVLSYVWVWFHKLQPTKLLHLWDFPGKNIGIIACDFLLHHIRVE